MKISASGLQLSASATPGAFRNVTIPQIHGCGLVSDLVGMRVRTRGVVTEVTDRGYIVQDPQGDDDPSTSDAIFVDVDHPDQGDGSAASCSSGDIVVGDEVEVTGQVTLSAPRGKAWVQPVTILAGGVTTEVLHHGQRLPEPVVIGRAGRLPPDKDVFEAQHFFGSLEWMRVRVDDAVVVGPTQKNGDVVVLAANGANAGTRTKRGGLLATESDCNPERITLAMASTGQKGWPPPFGVSDRIVNVTGIMRHDAGAWKLIPESDDGIISTGHLDREVARLTPTRTGLTVATFNVENLSARARERMATLGRTIVKNLCSPDIIGVQEIQDNDGPEDTGNVDASKTYAAIIQAIQDAGGPTYAWVDIPPQNNADGGQRGGNIRPGFLYRTDRVTYVDSSKMRLGEDDPAFISCRKPLVCRFKFNGQELVVINNHLSSKKSGTDELGLIQPPINGAEAQRTAQALCIGRYAKQTLDQNPKTNLVVLGDFNEECFHTPLRKLADFGLVPMDSLLKPNECYTYNHAGNSQALDHVFVPAHLLTKAEYEIVHLDSEFADTGRISDHDPAIIRLTWSDSLKSKGAHSCKNRPSYFF